MVIDNRAGAGGVIGADAVAKAPADGYTMLFDASAFAANPALRSLPFDARRDFIPVSLVVAAPNLFVVPPQAPYTDAMAEFLAHARSHPGELTYASAGNGSASHLAGETLADIAKVDLVHVPYKRGAPALNDLMGGQVSSYFGNTASTLGHVTSGRLRALGVGSRRRSPLLPEVPALIESGLPGFESQEWNGVFVPKGTPDEAVQRLAKDLQAAVADPAVHARLSRLGLEPVGSSPQESAAFVQSETAKAAALVKARGSKAD